ncbi:MULTISPECIES: hypothetical protein [Paraburkholderia]|uniref:Uncharacterized protein n=1 Tax=Paraburkholderia unamae TaxID=219649 RepID=A0ACC6RNQ9_9BURK
MSNLLAGDLGHALARVAPDVRLEMASIAPAGFATGFAAALGVAGCLALAVAALIWLLAGRNRASTRSDAVRL